MRSRLAMLTAALLLPAVLLTAFQLWRSYDDQNRAAERQLGDTARALSLALDRQLGQSAVLVSTLATSPYLLSGDDAAFYLQARTVIGNQSAWIVVVDERDNQVLNTAHPMGTALPRIDRRGNSWTPLANGVQLWNLMVQPGRRNPGMIVISRAVRRNDGSRVALAVITPASAFSRLFIDQKLPPNWTAAVIDARYIIVARNRQADRFVGTSASGKMRMQLHTEDQAVIRSTTLDGIESVTAYRRSERTRWTFLVAVPSTEFFGNVWQSLMWAMLAGVGLLGGGLLLARKVAGGIARPIEQLAASAAAMGRGETPQPEPSGLIEADAAAAVLATASGTIRAREDELRTLAQTLETRVAERTRELAEATEDLVQAQKMEALGRLTGGMAHDFNNLLTAVIGNLDLLERAGPDERSARRIAAARQAADRGAKLTAQLLAFARRQHLMPTAMDINRAIEAAGELLASTLGGSVKIAIRPGDDVWPAVADATQLDLVILNLAINARDAMAQGGTLTITTRNAVREDPAINAEQPAPGSYVAITVSDTGSGIAPEVRARIFEPFFTTKGPGQGTGLGLPQALGVMKQLGGGLEVVSTPGAGTAITLFLPRADGPPDAEAGPILSQRNLRGLRVLVVDDDEAVRAIVLSMLQEIGCRAIDAPGGAEALAWMDKGETIDLALLDYAMPGMNGAELAKAIAHKRPGVPILLMSGFADIDILAQEWRGQLLKKPFDSNTLSRRLAMTAERRRPL